MLKTQLVPKVSPEAIGQGPNSVKEAATPWWTYLEQHICIFCTGPKSTNRPSVGVSLNWRRLFKYAWGDNLLLWHFCNSDLEKKNN